MILVNNYVYCCAGLAQNSNILRNCERFNTETYTWSQDVPEMCNAKFSMTMLLMDKKWIYSFGGVNFNSND